MGHAKGQIPLWITESVLSQSITTETLSILFPVEVELFLKAEKKHHFIISLDNYQQATRLRLLLPPCGFRRL